MKVKALVRTFGESLVSLLLLSAGCGTTSPTPRFEAAAGSAGLVAGEVAGAGFFHRTFSAAGIVPGRRLIIYLGSDGTPFVRRGAIARDPTPRRAITLELLAQGPTPAVFLGRPCYHGLQNGCSPELWTIGRFSEPVVASMATAVVRLAERHAAEHVVLVGYSGGGALAVLVAERVDVVEAVVTLAAPLDIDAWTAMHEFSPLITSINPAAVAGVRTDLVHLHVTGAADANVPPALHDALRDKLPAAAFRILPEVDHRCCWVEAWPQLLAALQARLSEGHQAPR